MATVETGGMPVIMGNGSDNFCMGGGGFIWAFLIFALLMGNGGFGGWGNNNGNSNAIQNDINRGFDSQNTQANQREILSATNQVYHDVATNIGDKYSELTRDIANVGAGVSQAIANQCQLNGELKLQLAETGSGINANIAQSRFDTAMNTAAINATTTAQTQKILDAMAQNKIEALQGRINQLELAQATSNIVRYPSGWTYTAGTSPFCNCGGCSLGVGF